MLTKFCRSSLSRYDISSGTKGYSVNATHRALYNYTIDCIALSGPEALLDDGHHLLRTLRLENIQHLERFRALPNQVVGGTEQLLDILPIHTIVLQSPHESMQGRIRRI